MKNLRLIYILLFMFFACEDNSVDDTLDNSYSFFIAGHVYGKPGNDIVRDGLHPPFKNKFSLINQNSNIEFGIFLGDIVWESNEENWNNVDKDLIDIGKPTFFAVGNHDIENREIFESRYGNTYYHFMHRGDLHIFLDPNLDNWNISNEQLEYLKETLNNNNNVDNIFVSFHQMLWWSNDNIYQNVRLNSKEGRAELINFWSEIEPLFSSLENNVIMMAGDLGAGGWADSFMFHNYDNITFVASGMGGCGTNNCLGNDDGIGDDNFVIINVDINKDVSYELIAINRNNTNELGDLTDYILP